MTDLDMSLFIDNSLLGGVNGVFEPFIKANNLQMGDKYNPAMPTITILYMDACNLYGYSMSQFLPTGGFTWVDVSTKEDWADFILKQEDEQDEGYFLEVDLEYPEKQHNLHNAYPCAPEKLKVEENLLQEHQKELGRGCGVWG